MPADAMVDAALAGLDAVAITAAVAHAGLTPAEVDTTVMGDVVQAGVKMNPACRRRCAGLPVTVPAITVNRVCGSDAQAIVSAVQEILLGRAYVAIAGGRGIA